MTLSDNPTEFELLSEAVAAGLGPVRTSIPGRIIDYNSTKQTATVEVVVRSRYFDTATEEFIFYQPKPISNVPVQWPSGDGGSLTWPLAAGDPVTLVFADRSIDEWKSTAQNDNTPRDPRRFDLSDAIALPGARSPRSPLSSAAIDGSDVVLRAKNSVRLGDSTATDFVALASKVDAEIDKLWTALSLHVHPGVTTGPGSTGAPVVVDTSAPTGATKVKAV